MISYLAFLTSETGNLVEGKSQFVSFNVINIGELSRVDASC